MTAADSWHFVGSPHWIDGTRGRCLRSLYEPTADREVIAADLSTIVSRLQELLRQRLDRLSWGLTGNQLFQVLMDHVVARTENSRNQLLGPRRKASTPAGWSPEDECVWQEWLESDVLSPKRLDQLVFGLEPYCWELRLRCDWRQEVSAYLPYLVTRSRDILREIDPRPIVQEDEYGTEEEGGRRR